MLDPEKMRELMEEEGPEDYYDRRPVVDMSEGEELPPDEDEFLKLALQKQSREDAFGPDDPRSDDEIYAELQQDETWTSAMQAARERTGGGEEE